MKLLIAPWGDPAGWKEVTYEFDGKSVRSSTSLKILQETIDLDRTIIIGLDTLAERGRDYREVKASVEEKIKEYADKFGLVNYEILVAPGIGTFPNGAFYGSAIDYYYYIIAEISLKLLENREDRLCFHLDLTHGINYSTILAYKAIREVGETFAMFKKVELKAYNADPSLPAAGEKLSINVIEDSHLIPRPPAEKVDGGKPLESLSLTPEEEKKFLNSELKCVQEINDIEVSAFIGALYNGLPLALFRFYPGREKLKEIISAVLNSYEKHIEVKTQDKLKVIRKVRIGKDFKVYVFAYVIATLLKKLGLISCRKREVTLDEIKDIKDRLFVFDERLKNRISNDICSLRKDLRRRGMESWKVYNEILGRSVGGMDMRNFLAHSGFERNIIEVKKEGNRLILRYPEDRIEVIADFCRRGLR